MQVVLIRLGFWLGQKVIVAALIVGLGLAAYGCWLYLEEEALVEERRMERLAQATVEREQLVAAQAALSERLRALQQEVAVQRDRVRQAEKVVATLRGLQSWWERWFGNASQQSANEEQAGRMETLRAGANRQLEDLLAAGRELRGQGDDLGAARERIDRELAALEGSRSRVRQYLREAWMRTKWYVALALGGYFFVPSLWAVAMYFGFASLVERGRAIQIGPDPPVLPEVGESRVSLETVLQAGESLRVREKFLQASDEDLGRRTCLVLDWRIPVTSLACGLVELVELRPLGSGRDFRATLSNSEDPHIELAVVNVPAASSIVLRPHFLAGMILAAGESPRIRRHWRILHWLAWATGQFRFFEFLGPCRLIAAGAGPPNQPGCHHRLFAQPGLSARAGGNLLGILSWDEPAFRRPVLGCRPLRAAGDGHARGRGPCGPFLVGSVERSAESLRLVGGRRGTRARNPRSGRGANSKITPISG